MKYLKKIKLWAKTIICACVLTEIIVIETDIDDISISTHNPVSIIEIKNNLPNEETLPQ